MESKTDQDEVERQGYFFRCLMVKGGEWKKRRQQGLRWTKHVLKSKGRRRNLRLPDGKGLIKGVQKNKK